MFSLGEVFVLAVAAAWAFGPEELPRVARATGRFTGLAAGMLYRARRQFFKFAEETEISKLHQEVQSTMYQLHAIRSELQGGINIFSPGPITQRMMGGQPGRWQPDAAGDLQAAQQGRWEEGGQQAAAQAPSWAAQHGKDVSGEGAAAHTAQQLPGMPSWAASAVLHAQQRPATGQQQQQPMHAQHAQHDAQEQQHPLTLPVSAVAAGWAPNRAGTTPTGSELVLDALAEELVAAQLLLLQQQQQQQQAAAAETAAAQRQQQSEQEAGGQAADGAQAEGEAGRAGKPWQQ